ncbi:MAG TPA: hypothetical protein VGN52_04145 [Burkholderiales bacterium]|jgi:hypothetical protein
MNPAVKVLLTLLLLLAGCVSLGITACGGLFTVLGVGDALSGARGSGMSGALIMAVPALAIGLVGLYGCFKGLRSLMPPPLPRTPPAPPPEDGAP